MTKTDEFDGWVRRIEGARTFFAVFGQAPGDQDAQRAQVQRKYIEIARAIHPDVAPADQKRRAQEAFALLGTLREAAREAIAAGAYSRVAGAPESLLTLKLRSDAATYTVVQGAYREGEFSRVYPALMNPGERSVLVKIAAAPAHNARLIAEADLVKRLDIPEVADYLPQAIDRFEVRDAAGRRFACVVMERKLGRISLANLMMHFQEGLPAEHAAWIWRRVLAQAILARNAGLAHGALTPDHVMVCPIDREVTHLGWAHSAPLDGRRRVIHANKKWAALWYPREMRNTGVATTQTDIYQAGRTMCYLLNGPKTPAVPLSTKLPPSMQQVLIDCVQESPSLRATSPREVMDRWTRAIRDHWGRRYSTLAVPGKSG